jgi:hypothetical protein
VSWLGVVEEMEEVEVAVTLIQTLLHLLEETLQIFSFQFSVAVLRPSL